METVDNNNSNNNSSNNKEKTKRSFNPFRRDGSKSVMFSSSPLKQQEAVVNENINHNSSGNNNINSNNIENSNSSNDNREIPALTRQDSNSSISSTYSTSSCTTANNSNNNSNPAMNRPRSKSEKKDKLSFNTLISKASRKSMRIVTGANNNNINNNINNNETIATETPSQNTTSISLNSSTNSLPPNVSNDECFKNLNIPSGNNTLSVQDKKKNRGSIFVRLLSRKNKDDPISEEDFKIESGGSLPPLPNQHQHQQQQQFSSTPNLLAQSYSFNGQQHPSSASTTNLLGHEQQYQQVPDNCLASSMIAAPIKNESPSLKKQETLDSREETIKKIQLMANQLNETVRIPSQRNQHSNLSGNITPPRALDRQSSDQSFLSSYQTPTSTTPLSNHNKSNPFDSQHIQHNNSNEEPETEYSLDIITNIETSSTTSSTALNHILVPSTSSTSLSISSSSAFSPPSPIIASQMPTSTHQSNKHKRYTVAIPKWDASMNFNGNPFERLVQVLRNSTEISVVNNDYEEQLIQQQLNHLLIEEQQSLLSSSSHRNSIHIESPRLQSLPQSVIDGIEEEKHRRSVLLLCLSKLIKKLISEPNDDSILFKSFFTTYDCIFTSKDILNELSSLFKTESPQIQLRICNIIKFWLKDYYISQLCDFSFASEFKDFIVDIKNIQDSYLYSKIIELRNQLIYLLETKITERCLDTNSNSNVGVNSSSDSIDNSPEAIEKRYLNKKSTLKIKTFLSTSLKSYGFDLDFQQPPSPPSSPTHHRRFSPQTTSNGYMDGGVLSYSSLEQNGHYENEYDQLHHSTSGHRRQGSISSSTSTSFSLSSSTTSASHRKHNRSVSSNGSNVNTTNTSSATVNNSNQPTPITASNSLSFNQPSSNQSSSFWVQTRPRSSTWSSSDVFLSIMDAPAKEIAKSLTAIDFSIFLCIETQELMNGAWGKPHLKDKAPNIIKLISRFNEVSMNVIQTILNEEKLKDRCKVMARFIKIAKNLHELRNYNSLMAIYAGISHSSITRLKWTKKILPKTHQKTLQDLEKLMESDENFKNYRTELKTITSPCIPFLGLILSDMTFIQEGNPNHLGSNDETWQLNINKLKLMYNCIKQIQNFQKTAYLLNADPRLTLILTPNSNIFGEPQINYYQQPAAAQQQSQSAPAAQQPAQKEQPTKSENLDEILSPRSQIESIVPKKEEPSSKQEESTSNTNKDLTKIFSIPPLQNSKPLEKKNSQHDLLFRSFTLEDSISPVRKYSFNTWSSPKKVNFDIFNSITSTTNNSNNSNNPLKMERSQSEKYLPLNKVIPFNINLNQQTNNNSCSPREIESEIVKINNSSPPSLVENTNVGESNCNNNTNNENNNNYNNNSNNNETNNHNNASYSSNSNSSPSPSLSRPSPNNNSGGSISPSNSPTVSPQIVTPDYDNNSNINNNRLNKSCDNNIDNESFNLLNDANCQIAEDPQNGNSGNISPNSNISTVGSQSLFKRKSFDTHFIPRPAHSFVPMTDESLFSLSLKLEPRGVKLSDLA
ncbi:hypothetical protein DICPUDRAFT_147313 [Dictyostelium purpureum]|uniref:Ras guanine nucleotide exchange factor n=1 Tax=Dictyostelium purpureum TaxID=5786 RepID=F0Z867_DICPU|nr:uncharacterized protein DICPUDRAFT_147313 [Dictyostelium purpureum]EGC39841.1 hypothetical protein DICPUDRAFT_147313 [Dictyostelium purpureum]|eukprot:XP_003283592.1 hypothetical protein DICPUDRAFT_147313 [Dictyostelium purpureum]